MHCCKEGDITDYYRYAIHQNECITKCMVSEVKEIPYKSKPAPYPESCHVNQLWSEIISPVRTEYLKERAFETEEPVLPECGRVYFPFEAEKIEYSGFWMQPHNVTFGAQITLHVPEKGSYPFIITTCGGVKVFAGGRQQTALYSYNRNQEADKEISLSLDQGDNVIYVLTNDLAERDTQFYFKLRYTGTKTLEGCLPRKARPEALDKIRAIFRGMFLDRFNYRNNAIDLHFEQPVDEPLTVRVELVFTDAHTSTEGRCKEVSLRSGDSKVYIGDLLYKKVGMVRISIKTMVGDVELSRQIDFEYYDESLRQSGNTKTIQQRKREALNFISRYGLNDFQKVLALKETHVEEALAEQILEEELFRLNERYDCSDFRMPALIYAYRSQAFTGSQKQRIRETLLNFRYWFDEDGNDVMWFFSENHALNFHVSELLAGELFPDERFTNSGMTGAEHQRKAGKLLREWFDNFFRHGFNEWNSSVYIPIDMIAFFALYDMTQDAQMKALAQKALDKTFQVLGTNSFQGVVAASYGRIYFKNLIGRRTGESTALNYIASGQGCLNQHSFSVTLFALSAYEPSEEILNRYYVPEEGKVTRSVEGEEQVSLYSFKTPDYIMGSAYNYHPGEPGTQEHMLQVMIGDCDTQIWINHPGEAVYFGEGRPSYFAGNGTLPLVEQERNLAKATFHLLDQEVNYTHAFCPLSHFDTYCLKGKWLFLKKETVCAAIYADNGIEITSKGALKNYELVSPGKDNYWKVLIVKESAFGSFEKFVENIPGRY